MSKFVTINLRSGGKFNSIAVFRETLDKSVHGMTVSQLRARCQVLDALDEVDINASSINLSDTDHSTLVTAIETTIYTTADRELIKIIDDVLKPSEGGTLPE